MNFDLPLHTVRDCIAAQVAKRIVRRKCAVIECNRKSAVAWLWTLPNLYWEDTLRVHESRVWIRFCSLHAPVRDNK